MLCNDVRYWFIWKDGLYGIGEEELFKKAWLERENDTRGICNMLKYEVEKISECIEAMDSMNGVLKVYGAYAYVYSILSDEVRDDSERE